MAKFRTLKGTVKNDWLTGSDFYNDIIYAGFGNDVVFGLAGDDQLFGYDGTDALYGGKGDDLLDGGAGADYLDGGDGTDTVSYEYSSTGVYADLLSKFNSYGDAEGDIFNSIENLTGSRYGDTLKGTGGDNVIKGLTGNDTLFGRGGNDTLIGGAGNDAIIGGDGDDLIDGGTGDDILIGEDGNDTFIGGAGIDQHFGGDGIDTISYEGSTSRVIASLGERPVFNVASDAFGDTYDSVENLVGSNFGDSLYGNNSVNVIEGRGGSDRIFDFGGDDTVYGGDGSDRFYVGGGDDTIFGGDGDDRFYVGSGDNDYYGGTGEDWLDGRFSEFGEAVNLADGTGISFNVPFYRTDTYDGIEHVYGSDFTDVIVGDAGDNRIVGSSGMDWLEGGLGDDLLWGGSGFGGGDGDRDTFVFEDAQGLEADIIIDFEVGIDQIDFTATDFFGFNDLTNGGDRYMEQLGDDTVIHYYDHTITLFKVDANDLSADDFLFA